MSPLSCYLFCLLDSYIINTPPSGLAMPRVNILLRISLLLPKCPAWGHVTPSLTCDSLIWSFPLQLSEGMATQQTLHDLRPFTTYAIGVEACTCFNCCSRGPTAELRTHPAPPSGLSPPQVQTLGSRMASFQWAPPRLPNGVIHR